MANQDNAGTIEAYQREQRELQEKYAAKMQEEYQRGLEEARELVGKLNGLGDSISEITGEPHAPLMVARRQPSGGGPSAAAAPRSKRMNAHQREGLAADVVKAINDRDKGDGVRSSELADLYDRKQPSLRSFLNDNGQKEGKNFKVKGERAAQRFYKK